MFKDRIDAAVRLAEELRSYYKDDSIILGIPRGGAIVAHKVSSILGIPWDIIIPKKISLPFNNEVAMGAVIQDGSILLNYDIINYYRIPEQYIKDEAQRQMQEIKRRMEVYRQNLNFPNLKGKNVIIVDDGIATGFTIIAAINSVKKHNAMSITVAAPVASVDAISRVIAHCDEVICLETKKHFISVGESYINFLQTTDDEVRDLFKQNYRKIFV